MPKPTPRADGTRDSDRYTKVKKPTRVLPRERKFAQEFVANGGNARQAYLASHETKSVRVASKMGWISLQRPKIQALIKETEEAMIEQGNPSIAKLIELRDKATNEKVQLEAAKSLLDTYVGYTTRMEKAQEVRGATTNILIADLSTDELLARLGQFTGTLPGAHAEEVQTGPSTPDAGYPGVQEPGPDSYGGGQNAADSGVPEKKGTVPVATGSPQVNPDNH